MDPIDRRTATPPWHGSVDPRASAGQGEAAHERAQDPGDFRAWLEVAPDAQATREAEAVVAAAPTVTVALNMADSTRVAGVVYPWALQANAYLSQLSGHLSGGRGQATSEGAIFMEPASLSRADAGSSAFQAATSPHMALEDKRLPVTTGIATAMRAITGSSRGSDATPTDVAGTAFAATWSERLLRRTIDAEGNTTWWLRDYRMNAAEQEALILSLKSQPPQQRPHRIVINGVEVWRAPHSLPEP